MTLPSLHLRLSLAAAASIVVALTLSGIFLSILFERHVSRRVDRELSIYIKQLAASLEEADDGTLIVAGPLADDRFRRPLSGLYWQVETAKTVVLRSRSMWYSTLALPAFSSSPEALTHRNVAGPNGETLIVRSRTISLETATRVHNLRLSAAIDRNEVLLARDAFSRDLLIALAVLGVALFAASFIQIFVGLRPLKQVRQRVNEIRTGAQPQLKGDFPSEVALLVDEVNALIVANDQAVQRARDSAADLAHGLKTPLAILNAEGRSLAENQQKRSAEEIAAQVEEMRQRVERHLAAVRIRGARLGPVGRANVKNGLTKIVNAMKAMPRGEDLVWRVDVEDSLDVNLDRQDFFEVFGNLLDNARKWAKQDVSITGREQDDAIIISITDDGPGVPKEQLTQLIERGTRLDEQKTGAGLGLAIARKILGSYDATLQLQNSPSHGLIVIVSVPCSMPEQHAVDSERTGLGDHCGQD